MPPRRRRGGIQPWQDAQLKEAEDLLNSLTGAADMTTAEIQRTLRAPRLDAVVVLQRAAPERAVQVPHDHFHGVRRGARRRRRGDGRRRVVCRCRPAEQSLAAAAAHGAHAVAQTRRVEDHEAARRWPRR